MFLSILFIIFSLFFTPIFNPHNACTCMHHAPFGAYPHSMACAGAVSVHVMPSDACDAARCHCPPLYSVDSYHRCIWCHQPSLYSCWQLLSHMPINRPTC